MNRVLLFGVISLGVLLGDSAWGAGTTLVISEFRVRGPSGANDEFIELYNISGSAHTVASVAGATGYGVAASDGVLRATIPNGTVIPNHGHYLIVNSVAYSLAGYPAGSGAVATGNATYTTDIPDNAGIALFTTNIPANFALANRLDAVGSTSEANTLYKEGTGYPALTPFSIDYSFYRKYPGTAALSGTVPDTGCRVRTGANPVDTDNNAADFLFVDTNGTSAGAGQRLGAPGPENLSSPVQGVSTVASLTEVTRIDPTVSSGVAPNWVRSFTSVPAQNSTFGTLDLRRTYTNQTGANITRLRFRVIDVSTFPMPSGFADLRPITSADLVVVTAAGSVTARGTTLEMPPSQPNGTGFNGSLSVASVTTGTPLANGASVSVRFVMGIQQTGTFHFVVAVEAAPTEPGFTWGVVGHTDNGITNDCSRDPSSVALAAVPNPSTFGAAVTLSADVTPAVATGTIDFKDGATVLGTVTLVAGHATLAVSTLNAATHVITAAYSGETLYDPSVSTAVMQVVNKATTTVAVVSSLNPSNLSATVTFTATVAPSNATGTVTFKDGTVVLGTGTLAAGQATFPAAALTAGTHAITAAYAGDGNNAASVSPALNQVVKAPTTTTAVSSLNPSTVGVSVTFTATVAPSNATGTVTFKDGTAVLGTNTLTAAQATFATAALAAGTHAITAEYSGDGNDVASVSAGLDQVVQVPVVGTGGMSGTGGTGVGGATGTGGVMMVADAGADVRDSGAGGSGTGGSGTGGARVDASAEKPASGDSGGCGCTTTGGVPFGSGGLLLIAGVLVLARRRRGRG